MKFSNIKYIRRVTGTGIVNTKSFDIVPVNRTIEEVCCTRFVNRIVIDATDEPITYVAGLVVSIWATSAVFYANCNKK